MLIVDLQELEERARIAADSVCGVVLEPESLLLLINEIRRMKLQLGEQCGHLSGMRDDLLQLRTELVAALARAPASKTPEPPKPKARMLKMKVVAKDNNAAG